MIRNIIVILVMALWPISVSAGMGAKLDSRLDHYLDADEESTIFSVRAQPYWESEGDGYFLHLELDLRYDTIGMADGVSWEDSSTRKNVALGESYLEYFRDEFLLRLGNLKYNFSLLEEVSPSDMINPRDWSHMIDNEKRPVPSLQLRYETFDWFVEGVYVPYFIPSVLPKDDNPWNVLPRELELLDPEIDGRSEGQYLVRGGIFGSDMDMNFSLFYGNSYSPAFVPEFLDSGQLAIRPKYNREMIAAWSVSRYIGEFTLGAEIAYFDQDDRDDYIQYGLSLTRTFADVFRGKDSLYVMVQYVNEVVVNEELADDYDLKRVIQGVQAEMSYSFGLDWELKARTVINEDGDYYLSPSISKKIADWKLELGYNHFEGDRGEFFGDFRDNDQVYFKLSWRF